MPRQILHLSGVPKLLPPVAAGVFVLAGAVSRAAVSDPIVLLTEGQRREIAPSVRGNAELIPLDFILAGRNVATRVDAGAGSLTLTFQGRELVFYSRKSLASLGGDLRLLSSPVVHEDGRWLVPVDAVPRLIGPLLGVPAEWRAASRVLVLGDVSVPRVHVTTFVSGDAVRVVLDATEKVRFQVVQETGRVTVAMQRDLVEVGFQQERLTGGIVDLVQYVGGKDNLLAVTLGRRFQQLKAFELDKRLVLEFEAAPLASRATAAPAPQAPRAAPPQPAEPPARRILVIDPGHGGAEVGAQGPAGTLEKEVTLAIARKLRALALNTLGYQAFLTRDRDQELELDARPAIANNYKADIFVSIHANSSRAASANGTEVYFLSYQASDEESRRVALTEGEALAPDAPAAGGDVALILWDMAQAEHLEESSALASRIQDELAQVTGSEGRGVKQAPFRVLVGATMPAVLVEIAFISNPEEEKLLASDAFQNKVAAALARGIARFDKERERRAFTIAPSNGSR
jgi:N-acetylmuramoyl-L-alanine amidase